MKKKIKKFAMGGLGGVMGGLGGAMGGLGGAMGGMSRGSSLPNSSGMKNPGGPNPQFMGLRKAQQIAGEQGAMGGLGGVMGGLGGAIGGINPQQANAAQQAGMSQQAAQQAGMSRGLGGAMGGVGRGSSLPNSSGMKNFGGSSPQFMGDMLRKAQQIAGEQGARATQGDPLQGLRSKTPGNLPAMGNLRNVLAQTTGAKGKLFKKGGAVKASKSVSSVSKRADGIATKGKTRGKMI